MLTHRAYIGIVRKATKDEDWGGFIQFTDYGRTILEGSKAVEVLVDRSGGIKGDVSLSYFVQFTEDSERFQVEEEPQARLSGRMGILRQRLLCLICQTMMTRVLNPEVWLLFLLT